MKWPLVWRPLLTAAQAENAFLHQQLIARDEQISRLVNQITTMQRAGFKVADLPLAPPEPALPPEVVGAIKDHMDLSGLAGKRTAEWAEARLREGWQVANVIKRIHGETEEVA